MEHTHTRTDGGVATTTDLTGQVALLSGGTDGIGKAAATVLAERGATVVLVGSTRERGERAVEEIAEATGNDAVEFRQADLSLMAEVERLAEGVREDYDRLDSLVLTAGIVPHEQEMTEEGIEQGFAINYLSRFYLTTLLVDLLRESAPARVVNVGAAGQNAVEELDLEDLDGDRLFDDPEETDYMVRGLGALNQAQVANDVFGVELAERLDGSGVGVAVLNPGAVDTDIRLKSDSDGWHQVDEMLREEMGVLPAETVGETVATLATAADPSTISGRFFGPEGGAVDHQEGVDDPELRRRLWEKSADLAGATDEADVPAGGRP